MSITLLEGDCRVTLASVESGSVQCAITSPPYYSLRDYGLSDLEWADGWRGALGLEPSPDQYVNHVVECLGHLERVLREDGVLWLNLGDSYADKDLRLLPFRVVTALQARGWYVRSVIPWLKRNAKPENVRDRPTTSSEHVFLLARSEQYYWNLDAVRVPNSREYARAGGRWALAGADELTGLRRNGTSQNGLAAHASNPAGRNRRNTDWFFESWQGLMLDEEGEPLALVVNGAQFSGPHYATFPPRLIEPMVLASTRAGDLVLDPFAGSGTVGLVADRLGRNALLCELKPDYANIAGERITGDAPLFVQLEAF